MAHFDENNPQYRCCCQKCHVKTGALIIGILELIYAVILSIGAIRSMLDDAKALGNIIQFAIAAGFLITVILLIVGVIKVKKNLIIPHLIWQIVFIVIALIILILAILAFCGVGGTEDIKQSLGLGKVQQTSLTEHVTKELTDKTDIEDETKKREGTENAWTFIVGLAMILVTYGLGILLEIWFFLVVRGAYRWARDKQHFQNAQWEGVPLSAKA